MGKGMLRCVATAALVLGASLIGLRARDIWPPDEGRYATVAREMAAAGIGPTLTLNGTFYADKPPLFFWITTLAARLTGGAVDEAIARVPSVLGAALMAGIVFAAVRRVAGWRAGAVASACLASSALFLWQSRAAQLDMLFAAFVAASALRLHGAVVSGRTRDFLGGFLALLLAILTKGPLALLVLPVVVLHAILTGRGRGLARRGAAAGFLLLLAGAGAFVLWAGSREPEFLRASLGYHTIERMERGLAHENPWHFYLRKTPLYLLPWSPLLLLLPARPWRNLPAEARSLFGFAALHAGLFLAIQSAFPGKRGIYLLPLWPALVIVVALAVEGTLLRDAAARARRCLAGGTVALGAILAALGGAVALGAVVPAGAAWLLEATGAARGLANLDIPVSAEDSRFPDLLADLRVTGLALLLPAVAAPLLVRRGGIRGGIVAVAAAVVLAGAAGTACMAPWFNRHQSRRTLAAHALALSGKGGPIGIYRHMDEGLLFYAGRNVKEVPAENRAAGSAAAFLDGAAGEAGRPVLVVRWEELREIPSLRDRMGRDLELLAKHRIRKRHFVIVGRRAP